MTDRAELQKIAVAKLREHAELLKHNVASWQILGRAADEIERLSAEDERLRALILDACKVLERYDLPEHAFHYRRQIAPSPTGREGT